MPAMAIDGEARTASPPAAGDDAPSVTRVVLTAWPLLASLLLLMAGAGLQGSLLGVRAEQARFSSGVTGLILGVYFIGYIVGSSWAPGLIRSVGHIRVFAALASTASAAVVVHGIWVSPVPWLVLRFVTGVCIAGLFVVSESWLNDVATTSTRATLLSVYNSVVSGGLAVGTGLLNLGDTGGVALFVIGSVVVSMAAVPVTLAPTDAPPPRLAPTVPWRTVLESAPLGSIGVMASGLGVGAALGFGAVYATRAGFGVSGASAFVIALLLGASVGQIPLGNWSDRTDRRYVVFTAAFLMVIGSIIGLAATHIENLPLALVAAVLLGAGAFSLYGLSVAHVADYVEPEQMLSVASRLLILNGIGAASGPILASAAIGIVGPEGIFWLLGLLEAAFCGYVAFRVGVRPAAPDAARAHYTPLTTGATVGSLDEVLSEVTGVEFDEIHRRRRPTLATIKRAARRAARPARRRNRD